MAQVKQHNPQTMGRPDNAPASPFLLISHPRPRVVGPAAQIDLSGHKGCEPADVEFDAGFFQNVVVFLLQVFRDDRPRVSSGEPLAVH